MHRSREDARPREQKRPLGKNEITNTVPPHSLEAERAVIGSILRDNDCLFDVMRVLKAESFYSDKHQRIFQTICEMFEVFEPIDPLTLAESLTKKKWLKEVGGADAILEIYHETITAANVSYYAKIVHEKEILRTIYHTSIEMMRSAVQPSNDAQTILNNAEQTLAEIAIGTNAGQRREIPLPKVISETLEAIQNRKYKKNDIGISSGFTDLDLLLGGLRKQKLIILAARPSVGKSAFAGQIADYASVEEDKHVQFFSLEMKEHEIVERLIASNARVNATDLTRGFYDEREELQRILAAANRLSGSKLSIRRFFNTTLGKIRSACRRAAMKKELDLVIVDYLQLIRGSKFERREEVVAGVSRGLKDLAGELDIPVLCLCQLNRDVEKRENNKPRLSDLRESGAIEQDADSVIFLYKKRNGVGVVVAKNRDGPVDEFDLNFDAEFVRFRDVPRVGQLNGF